MKMLERLKPVAEGLKTFSDKAGFPLLVTICVGVIASTAVWTRSNDGVYVAPTPPPAEAGYAALQLQQSLHEATLITPLPTRSPVQCTAPLKELKVLRAFSGESLVQSGVSGIWSVHTGVDLEASAGEKILSISEGTVADLAEEGLEGAWVVVNQADGSVAKYAGLSMLGALRKGDRIRQGQTIGFAGNTHISERDLGPHLHLEIWQDGKPIDPMRIIN